MSDNNNNNNEASRWDFFSRPESNRAHPKTLGSRCYLMHLPTGTTLEDALAAYYAAGYPKGSHRSGVFEVQCERGIYYQIDGNRIDLSTPRKAAKVRRLEW